MIKSNNSVNIEGTVIDHDELRRYMSLDDDDAKTKWLVKPLVLVSGAGLAIAALFASLFLVAASFVIMPLLAIAMWTMKSKYKKAAANTTGATDASEQSGEVNFPETPASVSEDFDSGKPNPA